jgi:hypothetical protein
MSDIPLLLLRGWKNIWKEKILWLFSALVLVEPLVRTIQIQKSVGLLSSFLNLIESLVFLVLICVSYAGVPYVAYCIAADKPVNIQTTFLAVKKFLWRFFVSTLLLGIFYAPCLCSVYFFLIKQPPQISDFSHNLYFAVIPLSIFSALWDFLLAEIIRSDSGIRESLKTAWSVFSNHFFVLAAIGIALAGASYVISITTGMATILIQYNFNLSSLSKLDYLSPALSFIGNNWYKLLSATALTFWNTYITSVFISAYLKYANIKMDEAITS